MKSQLEEPANAASAIESIRLEAQIRRYKLAVYRQHFGGLFCTRERNTL
jgi:hypothetical protein